MKIKTILFILPIIFFFQSCSWVINFYIVNQTSKKITIEVELVDSLDGFTLFQNSRVSPTIYKLNNNSNIKFEESIELSYSKIHGPNHYEIIIPPKTALVIGSLHNDKYTSYDQYFINGRVFNLKQIKITSANSTKSIIPKTFDAHFKKEKNGEFYFRITD